MKSSYSVLSLVLVSIFVSYFYSALGQVAIVSNPKKNKKYGGDTIVFGRGGGCPPGLVRDGGEKGTSVLAIPLCKPPPPKPPKVEFVAYPVKEYVPLPVPVIKEKPIIIEVEKKQMEMPMMHMEPGMAEMGDMYDMGMGFGLDSKKSVTHVSNDKKSNEKQKKKVIKVSRNDSKSGQKRERECRPLKRTEETTNKSEKN